MKRYLLPLLFLLLAVPAFSQFVHRSTLVGTGWINTPLFGTSVAISADGNVAVVGGEQDNTLRGGAWVYTRNGNTWTQMGSKLIPSGFTGTSTLFGCASAISADGSTIAIGGYEDNSLKGATWIFVRNGNTWVQQGPKLVGGQTVGSMNYQGRSIALSADGNTLLIGGREDNAARGSAWVFQRTGTTWAQQGNKLEVTPNFGWYFGVSVALSADGNTALIGVSLEGNGHGYFYKRTGTTWNFVQKVTDISSSNYLKIGEGVALSGNGKVAVISGPEINNSQGLLWFYRFNPTTQLFVKEQTIIPTGATAGSRAGRALSLSKGGDTLVAGGDWDANAVGGVWTFIHNSSNTWTQLGPKITVPANGGSNAPHFGQSVSITADGKIFLAGRPGGALPGSAHVYSDPSVLGWKEDQQADLKLYPNPVQDFLQLPADHTFSHLTVSDLTGKVLLRTATPGQRLDLSRFSSGVYLVSLHQKDKVQHVRIVKE